MWKVSFKPGTLKRSWLVLFCLCLALTSCAGADFLAQADARLPRLVLDDVPFVAQQDYQCGPAAVAMLLAYNSRPAALEELIEQVYSPDLHGSIQPSLIAALRRHGLLAYQIKGFHDLVAELDAGHPVLILQNLGLSWVQRWHYSVVVGYDRQEKTILLHSADKPLMEMSVFVFANTWRRSADWGLVALNPGTLPATAQELPYLKAVSALEQIGLVVESGLAYEVATHQWPTSFTAWFGWGNSLYAQAEFPRAAEALEQAVALRPASGPALNNLALARNASGQKIMALETIQKAINLGGPYLETYLNSRREILDSP